MLEKDELVASLKKLGINEINYRVISVLPLVLVAWADGKVQQAEKNKIFEIAGKRGLLVGGGDQVLSEWLDQKPSPSYFDLGFQTLVELARKQRGPGANLSAANLRELIDLSSDVALAAGGLFGHFWTVSEDERQALDRLAATLSIDDGQSWGELLEDLEE